MVSPVLILFQGACFDLYHLDSIFFFPDSIFWVNPQDFFIIATCFILVFCLSYPFSSAALLLMLAAHQQFHSQYVLLFVEQIPLSHYARACLQNSFVSWNSQQTCRLCIPQTAALLCLLTLHIALGKACCCS